MFGVQVGAGWVIGTIFVARETDLHTLVCIGASGLIDVAFVEVYNLLVGVLVCK